MYEVELNPMARYIMALDNWDVSLFVGCKMFGTILTLGILFFIYSTSKKYAFTVSSVIAMLQTALFFYLSFDVPDFLGKICLKCMS